MYPKESNGIQIVFDQIFKKEKKNSKMSICMQKINFHRVKVFKKVYLYPKKRFWYSNKDKQVSKHVFE